MTMKQIMKRTITQIFNNKIQQIYKHGFYNALFGILFFMISVVCFRGSAMLALAFLAHVPFH